MSTDDAWVGVGFSRDREMGQDDIYYCQKRAGVIGMISAYSVGMSRPIELDATNNQNGISQLRTYVNQNQFVCSFRRPVSVTKDNLGKVGFVELYRSFLRKTFSKILTVTSEYDLNDGQWHILLSTGQVQSDSTSYHGPSASGSAIASR